MEITVPFEAICQDASGRPNEIPISKWLVAKRKYTVIKIERMNAQGNMIGFRLKELDISEYFPYINFGAWRFGIPAHVLQLAALEAQMQRTDIKEEIPA